MARNTKEPPSEQKGKKKNAWVATNKEKGGSKRATDSRKSPSKQKGRGNQRRAAARKTTSPDPSETKCLRKEVRYINIDEEVVVILLDRLELHLLAYLERPSARGKDLAAAVTFTVALFLVLVTADFHPRFGVPGSSWRVLCGVCFVGSLVWSGFCIHSAIRALKSRKGVKEFIAELTENCRAIVSNRQWKCFDEYIDDGDSELGGDQGVQ